MLPKWGPNGVIPVFLDTLLSSKVSFCGQFSEPKYTINLYLLSRPNVAAPDWPGRGHCICFNWHLQPTPSRSWKIALVLSAVTFVLFPWGLCPTREKLHPMVPQTDPQNHRRTWRLYDWIGPVASEKVIFLGSNHINFPKCI